MKTLIQYHFRSWLLTFLLIGTISAQAQFTDKKVVRKAAVISSDARVSINNKHGVVQINAWEKDSIRVKIEILGSSKDLEKLENMMSRTKIIAHVNKDYVDIATSIDEGIISKEWKNIKSIAGYSGEQIKVNYYVYLPQTCKLKINHEFGNLYMNDFSGALDIRMDHGDLRAGNLKNLDYAELSFVNAYIKSVQNSSIINSFGDLDIKSANYIKIQSKAGSLELGDIKKMNLNSSRDKVEVETLGELDLVSSLSKIEIEVLTKSLDADMKYGKLRVDHVKPTCTMLSLNPNRSTLDLYFDPNCNFVVDGHGDDLEFVYEPGIGSFTGTSSRIQGHIGSKTATNKIYIHGDHSTISLNKS